MLIQALSMHAVTEGAHGGEIWRLAVKCREVELDEPTMSVPVSVGITAGGGAGH